MKRLALVGFPDGIARQDITPTLFFTEAILDRALPIIEDLDGKFFSSSNPEMLIDELKKLL